MSKTAKGLVEYCKAQLGKPYWWGTFGQTATASLLASKRAQYPGEYRAADFEGQFGQKVHDCVGLIKGYRWCDGPEDGAPAYKGSQDVSVAGLFDQCDLRGSIGTMPDAPGVCVFRGDMGHVGVYIGNGWVIEARGHASGVIQSPLNGSSWAFWGMPDWIDYDSAGGESSPGGGQALQSQPGYEYSVKLGLLKPGMRCEQVRTVQRLLIARGISCGPDGADGEFGPATRDAVMKFQQLAGLLDDGEVGGETWAKLLKG